MVRYKRVNGERVQFTAEEETARDAEESAWATELAAIKERQAKIDALKAKITDGTATHSELLEYTQYDIGAKQKP